jgi:hypothetical protein
MEQSCQQLAQSILCVGVIVDSLQVMVQMSLLGLALAVGQVLERNKINWMSEAGGALIVGILLGLIVTLASNLNYNYYSFFKFNVRIMCSPHACMLFPRPLKYRWAKT